MAPSNWTFSNPVRLQFGAGSRRALLDLLDGKAVLAVSSARGRAQFSKDPIVGCLADAFAWIDDVKTNPGLVDTQAAIDRIDGGGFDAVLAIGGGSAMDVAKAVAAALAPQHDCRDLARLIADPQRYLVGPVVPIYALPTTSGTGAEVTPFATIWDHENRKKLSLSSPYLFPHTAVVDPELTYGLPRDATVSTALDALNQAFESVWNKNRNPVTTALAGRAIGLGLAAIPRLVECLEDHSARDMLAQASMLAGICISHTRTAICHSISYPLTAHFGIAHGFACAATMSAVAKIALENVPEGLAEVALFAGYGDPQALVDALDRALDGTQLGPVIADSIPSFEALYEKRGEMLTPGRGDNFVVPVDGAMLDRILTVSFSHILRSGSSA